MAGKEYYSCSVMMGRRNAGSGIMRDDSFTIGSRSRLKCLVSSVTDPLSS